MDNHEHPAQITITDAIRGGWLPDTKQSWIELKTDNGDAIRLIFADTFPPTLKLRLQEVQRHVSDERRKAGLPVMEQSYVEAVERLEFGSDILNHVAVIRTRFQSGASQDTVISQAQIPQTIEHLTRCLREFETSSKSPKQ